MTGLTSWLWTIALAVLIFLAGLGIDSILERAERKRDGHCEHCDGGRGWDW